MPRAGWLAIGGLGMALLAMAGSSFVTVLTLGGLAGTLCVLLLAIHRGRADIAALTVGAAAVALRILIGTALSPVTVDPGPPPTANASWIAQIERVGSTEGGMQRALTQVIREGTDGA